MTHRALIRKSVRVHEVVWRCQHDRHTLWGRQLHQQLTRSTDAALQMHETPNSQNAQKAQLKQSAAATHALPDNNKHLHQPIHSLKTYRQTPSDLPPTAVTSAYSQRAVNLYVPDVS